MAKVNEKELKELLIQIKNDHTDAFEKLYHRYNKLVYGIAFSIIKNKQDAEDMVQIVFTKIFSISKSKLPSKNETSWLYTITKNETINYLKKRNNHISLEEIYEIEESNNDISKIIDKESYHKLLKGLSNKEKEIISLKILANLSFEEIAKMLKMPTGTVKWHYYKSIHTLKLLLSNLGMFIVTAILSITTLKNKNKTHLPTKPETTNIENEEETKKENTNQTPTKEDTNRTENATFENSNSQTPENVIEVPITNTTTSTNYIGMSFLGLSAIFFVLTIIFSIIFTKYQLKRRKKLSK